MTTDGSPSPIPGPDVSFRQLLSDPRTFVDGVVPTILFVATNAFWGLGPAAASAAGFAMAMVAYRIARRHRVAQAFGGLAGVGIALVIALRTGKASAYFVPGVVTGSLMGLVALASVLVGRPATAAIARIVQGHPASWYRSPRVRNAHAVVTLAWTLSFWGRAALRAWLVANDETALAGVSVALGFPVTAAMLVGSWAFLRWRLADVPPSPVGQTA